jgi:hypothetical protein
VAFAGEISWSAADVRRGVGSSSQIVPTTIDANLLFPPIFHRPTFLCEQANGRNKVNLYSWTQGSEYDGFFGIGGRSLEDSELQAEAWELYFGAVFEQWSETDELSEGDAYWRAYGGQGEDEADQ